jgi:excisionase family DNA binding protein
MEFLTTQQAADKLGVHRSRIHALIQAGRLPAEKFGNVYMIKEDDLKLVAERKIGRPLKPKDEKTKANKKSGKR